MALLLLPISALAETPRVTIDVSQAVECQEVPSTESVKAGSGEKIVEATFHVSVLLESGSEQDLEQLRLAIESPQHRLRVVDFLPRTELASELASDVEVNSTTDTNASLNVSPSGLIAGQYGPVHVQAAPAAGIGVSQTRGSKETYHRLAPKQLVLASGTMDAQHGVFFKWRRSSQIALEGSRDATVRFAVPRSWRADWVRVSCEVLARHHGYFGDKIEPCGQMQLFAGLFLAGDSLGQQAAQELSEEQMQLPTATAAEPVEGFDMQHGGEYVTYRPVSEEHHCDLFRLSSILGGRERTNTKAEPPLATTDLQMSAPARLSLRLDALRQLSGR